MEFMQISNNHFILFTLDDQQFVVPLASVESIARSVQITPLPNAPDVVQGVIDVRGRIIPVINIRKRFHFPEKELDLNDHLIIGRTLKQAIAFVVDNVEDIIDIPKDKIIEKQHILPGLDHVEGAAKIEGDLIIIHNIEKCLSIEEEQALNEVMIKKEKIQDRRGKKRGKESK